MNDKVVTERVTKIVTKNGKALLVPADSLDTEPNVQPNDTMFWAERAGWYNDTKQAKKCE
jgi:hypothetical protein